MNPSDQPQGELVIQTIAMPKDTNRDGDIFGGWLVSQMDLGSAILAGQIAKSRVVTVAIEGMSFLNPVRVGDTVACYAWVEKIGRTSPLLDLLLDIMTVGPFPASLRAHRNAAAKIKKDDGEQEEKKDFLVHAVCKARRVLTRQGRLRPASASKNVPPSH